MVWLPTALDTVRRQIGASGDYIVVSGWILTYSILLAAIEDFLFWWTAASYTVALCCISVATVGTAYQRFRNEGCRLWLYVQGSDTAIYLQREVEVKETRMTKLS